jgi:hypothetical protein
VSLESLAEPVSLNEEAPYCNETAIETNLEIHPDVTEESGEDSSSETSSHAKSVLVRKYYRNVLVLGVSLGFFSSRMYGLLLLQQDNEEWRRLGLCFWETLMTDVGAESWE